MILIYKVYRGGDFMLFQKMLILQEREVGSMHWELKYSSSVSFFKGEESRV